LAAGSKPIRFSGKGCGNAATWTRLIHCFGE
jgi:hypothetical protein